MLLIVRINFCICGCLIGAINHLLLWCESLLSNGLLYVRSICNRIRLLLLLLSHIVLLKQLLLLNNVWLECCIGLRIHQAYRLLMSGGRCSRIRACLLSLVVVVSILEHVELLSLLDCARCSYCRSLLLLLISRHYLRIRLVLLLLSRISSYLGCIRLLELLLDIDILLLISIR